MKKLILISVLFFDFFILYAQEEFYTHSFENGYMWNYLNQPTNQLKDYKHNYLASLLENQKLNRIRGIKPLPLLQCDKDIVLLYEKNKANEIDLDLIVKMINNFYTQTENLVIPIMGAYCYCIKELAGYKKSELEFYRRKLIEFSGSDLEQ